MQNTAHSKWGSAAAAPLRSHGSQWQNACWVQRNRSSPASCLCHSASGNRNTEIQWPVYTQMFLSSFHRDYWEQSTYSKPNLTPGKFPAHKSANALQRNMYQNGNGTGLQRRWSIPQNLCLKPCYIAAFLIVVAGRLPRVKKLLHCWGS